MKLPPLTCDTMWFFIYFCIPPSLEKSDGWRTESCSTWSRCLFLLSFFERSLKSSLWPNHWQMLLWNVMNFEMGAAVTIILGQGLSLAWYHYLCQLAARSGAQEVERWRDLVTAGCGGSKHAMHSQRDGGLFCVHNVLYMTVIDRVCSQRNFYLQRFPTILDHSGWCF